MADQGGADYALQVCEVEMQIAQQELNIKAGKLRLRQIAAEQEKVQDNISSAEIRILELKDKLEEIEKIAEK